MAPAVGGEGAPPRGGGSQPDRPHPSRVVLTEDLDFIAIEESEKMDAVAADLDRWLQEKWKTRPLLRILWNAVEELLPFCLLHTTTRFRQEDDAAVPKVDCATCLDEGWEECRCASRLPLLVAAMWLLETVMARRHRGYQGGLLKHIGVLQMCMRHEDRAIYRQVNKELRYISSLSVTAGFGGKAMSPDGFQEGVAIRVGKQNIGVRLNELAAAQKKIIAGSMVRTPRCAQYPSLTLITHDFSRIPHHSSLIAHRSSLQVFDVIRQRRLQDAFAKWQRRRNVTPHQRHLQQIRVQGVRAAMQLLGNEIFDEAQQKHAPGSDHQVPIAQCDKQLRRLSDAHSYLKKCAAKFVQPADGEHRFAVELRVSELAKREKPTTSMSSATEAATEAQKQKKEQRQRQQKQRRALIKSHIREQIPVVVGGEGLKFEGKSHGNKATLANKLYAEGADAGWGWRAAGRGNKAMSSLYTQAGLSDAAEKTVAVVDAQRYLVVAPAGLEPGAALIHALIEVLLKMLVRGKELVVRGKTKAVFYNLDTTSFDGPTRSITTGYRGKDMTPEEFQKAEADAKSLTLQTRFSETKWAALMAQKKGTRPHLLGLLHGAARSQLFQGEKKVLGMGSRTAHVLVGGPAAAPFFTAMKTGTTNPPTHIRIGSSSVAIETLLTSPRQVVRHAEGERAAVALVLNLVEAFAPAVQEEAQAQEARFGGGVAVNPLTIVIDAVDSDVLLGLSMPTVHFVIAAGFGDVTRLLLAVPSLRGPQKLVDLGKMYSHFEGDDELPRGASGSRAIGLAAVFASGGNDIIMTQKGLPTQALFKVWSSDAYQSSFVGQEVRPLHGDSAWDGESPVGCAEPHGTCPQPTCQAQTALHTPPQVPPPRHLWYLLQTESRTSTYLIGGVCRRSQLPNNRGCGRSHLFCRRGRYLTGNCRPSARRSWPRQLQHRWCSGCCASGVS